MNKLEEIYIKEMNNQGVVDEPKASDYSYDEVYGGEGGETNQERVENIRIMLEKAGVSTVLEYWKKKLIIENQGGDQATKKSCTRQGVVNLSNCQNLVEYGLAGEQYEHKSAKQRWIDYEKSRFQTLGIRPGTKGSSLQSALEEAVKLKDFSGYAKVWSIKEAKNALDRLDLIYTGSAFGDRKHTIQTGIYRRNSTNTFVGHAFCIVSYDEEGEFFWAVNSRGPKYGFFKIPFSEWNGLYSRYACIDTPELLDRYRQSKKDIRFLRRRLYRIGKKRHDTESLVMKNGLHELANQIRELIKKLENA